MITCTKCSKDNQDHYKFCLGCGAELPRGNAPKPFTAATPPQGVPAVVAPAPAAAQAPAPPPAPAPVPAPPASAAQLAPVAQAPRPAATPAAAPVATPAAAGPVTCPQCGHSNPTSNRFCAACGYSMASIAPAPAAPPAATSGGLEGVTLTALRADGTEAGHHPLAGASATVGRDTGSIFAGDSYLSPRHATLRRAGAQVFVKDEGSLNGVYIKLQPNVPWPLQYGDIFRIGQEIIRFEQLVNAPPSPDGVERFGSPAKGYIGRLALVIGRDTTGNAFPIPERGVHCGRERGDILFSEDGYVSGLHCRIGKGDDGNVYLTDVGSSNGTFARLSAEHLVAPHDILLMGQQLFRVDY